MNFKASPAVNSHFERTEVYLEILTERFIASEVNITMFLIWRELKRSYSFSTKAASDFVVIRVLPRPLLACP